VENEIVGRLYYNRNKSHSFNNLGQPHSTTNKNTNILSSLRNISIKEKDEEFNKTNKNNFLNEMVSTHANNFKKTNNETGLNKYELNDFNAFLEKLSNYENKKTLRTTTKI
jgi:hypothetical protein